MFGTSQLAVLRCRPGLWPLAQTQAGMPTHWPCQAWPAPSQAGAEAGPCRTLSPLAWGIVRRVVSFIFFFSSYFFSLLFSFTHSLLTKKIRRKKKMMKEEDGGTKIRRSKLKIMEMEYYGGSSLVSISKINQIFFFLM